jgi:alpha-glucuronidase
MTGNVRLATSLLFVLLASAISGDAGRAETGYDGWLRYAPIKDEVTRQLYRTLPDRIVVVGDGAILASAAAEFRLGIERMLGKKLSIDSRLGERDVILLGTAASIEQLLVGQDNLWLDNLDSEGFVIKWLTVNGNRRLCVIGGGDRGLLYGTYALLRIVALHRPVEGIDIREEPAAPIRILNHWDNLDGTIERGYAGRSIFWKDDHVTTDLTRARDYARLMASVGLNGCSINNVNADARVVSTEYLPEIARIAEVFRPWGVRLYVSLNFASPREIGRVETFDPLDPAAVAFWKQTVDDVYRAVPDLGGFVLKADSEGRLGPSEYGRTHADAANAIARALKPHGGVLFYRGFVYDHRMDWRDLKNDRAKAAYDNFHRLDGQFEDNVIIQIKHGPIDFQVREPVSPLFGGFEKTNQAIELQITQEYLGQQRHVCYTVPMWKEGLDFDMHAGHSGTPVKELVAGKTFNRPTGGFVGVSNVGREANWLGHHLAMANLYGFGRLAWNPHLSSEQIADEWTRLTFDHDSLVVETITDMLLRSWPVYESYTGNLGIGTLTDIIHIHFGPAPESSEYNGWGQWHRANETGVGMNRTVATGTKFIGQYRPPVAAMFESLDSCPDELLLFMHHVPYSRTLKSGKTVIQHFYDEHYKGAEQVATFPRLWRKLQARIDDQRYHEVLSRLEYQAAHAQVWRDSICRWFMKRSGIADERRRVGNYPDRAEAEKQKVTGYELTEIVPWEAASGDGAVMVPDGLSQGTLTVKYEGPAGCRDVWIQYFDEEDGVSTFTVFLNDKPVDEWQADGHVPTPTTKPDAHSSTRRIIRVSELAPGDEFRIVGRPDQGERAVIDYIEFAACEED